MFGNPFSRDQDSPIKQKVKEESMQFLLGQENSLSIPSWLIPRSARHTDSYIVR